MSICNESVCSSGGNTQSEINNNNKNLSKVDAIYIFNAHFTMNIHLKKSTYNIIWIY